VTGGPLSLRTKSSIAFNAWRSFARVQMDLRRLPLPRVVSELGRGSAPPSGLSPTRLGVVVQKALTVGPVQPRCLISALVLYDLLRREGEEPTLVIGLPDSPATKDAHAWVELEGLDVGPPPGRGQHQPLARYGA
jgi:Transglutaminase-like superfamily